MVSFKSPRIALICVTVAAVLAGLPTDVRAQHSAVWKVLGHDPDGWSSFTDHQGAARRVEHAADYASDLQGYIVETPKPDPVVVKEMANEIGRNLEAAKKHFASMKKAATNDKETVAAIEKIEKHLSEAFDHHKMVMECCTNEDFDHIKTMTCCSGLSKEISKVNAEHNELMNSLAKKALVKKAAETKAAK